MSKEQLSNVIKSNEKKSLGLPALMKKLNLNIFKSLKDKSRNNLNADSKATSIKEVVENFVPNEVISAEVQAKLNNEKPANVAKLSKQVNEQIKQTSFSRLLRNENGKPTFYGKLIVQLASIMVSAQPLAQSGYNLSKLSSADIDSAVRNSVDKLEQVVDMTGDYIKGFAGQAAHASEPSITDFQNLKNTTEINQNLTIDKSAPLLDASVLRSIPLVAPVIETVSAPVVIAPEVSTKTNIDTSSSKEIYSTFGINENGAYTNAIANPDFAPQITQAEVPDFKLNKQPKLIVQEVVAPEVISQLESASAIVDSSESFSFTNLPPIAEYKGIEPAEKPNFVADKNEVIIELETKVDENIFGEQLTKAQLPEVYSKIDTVGGVTIFKGEGRVFAQKSTGEFYQLKADVVTGIGSDLAQKAVSIEGITKEDLNVIRDRNENTSFTAQDFADAEMSLNMEMEDLLSESEKLSGYGVISPDAKKEFNQLGTTGVKETGRAAQTLNWLRTQDKATNASFWKAVEFARTNPDAPRSPLMDSMVKVSMVYNIDAKDGITFDEFNQIAGQMPVSQTESLKEANFQQLIRKAASIDAKKWANVGNGSEGIHVLNFLDNYTKEGFHSFQNEQARDEEYERISKAVAAAQSARAKENSPLTNFFKLKIDRIKNQTDKLDTLQDYTAKSNALTEATGGTQYGQAINENGREAFIGVTKERETTGTSDYQTAKTKTSLNLFKTLLPLVQNLVLPGSSTPTLGINHQESVEQVLAQPGAMQKMNDILEYQGTDLDTTKEVNAIMSDSMKIGKDIFLTVLSMTTGANIPFDFYEKQVSVGSGTSTPFVENSVELQNASELLGTIYENAGEIDRLISEEQLDADEAIMKATGLKGKELEAGKTLIAIVANPDTDAYTQLDVDVFNISTKDIQDFASTAKIIEAASNTPINIEASNELSVGFVNAYKEQIEQAGQKATVRGMMYSSLEGVTQNKGLQATIINRIENGKLGQIEGTNIVLKQVTLSEVANITTDGKVIVTNTVGTNNNTAVKVNTIKASKDMTVTVLEIDGKLAGGDGFVQVYHEQCHGNPGVALRVENIENIEVCMELEICPLGEDMAHGYNANPIMAAAHTDNGEGLARLNSAGSESAQRRMRDQANVAFEEASKREINRLKYMIEDFNKTGIIDNSTYAKFMLTPNTSVGGQTVDQIVKYYQESPEFAGKMDAIFNAPSFTEAVAYDASYQSDTQIAVGFKASSDSKTKKFVNQYATDTHNIKDVTTVTQSRSSVRQKMDMNSQAETQVVYMSETTAKVINEIDDACDEVQNLTSNQIGLGILKESSNAKVDMKFVESNTSVNTDTTKTEIPKPEVPREVVEIEEGNFITPTPIATAPGQPQTPLIGSESNPTAPTPVATAPGQPQTPVQGGEVNPTTPTPVSTNPGQPQNPNIGIEGNLQVTTPGSTAPNGNAIPNPGVESAPIISVPGAEPAPVVTPKPEIVIQPKIENVETNVQTPTPAVTNPSDREAELGFQGILDYNKNNNNLPAFSNDSLEESVIDMPDIFKPL
jgi:hypothetical protein